MMITECQVLSMFRSVAPNMRICVGTATVIIFAALTALFTARDPLGAFQSYSGHSKPVYSAEFDPSGEFIASAGEDGLRIWRVSNGEETLRRNGWIRAARFLPSGNRLVCADTKAGFLILDSSDNHVERTLALPNDWMVLEVSKHGEWIAGAACPYFANSSDVQNAIWAIHVWKTTDNFGESLLIGHEGPVTGLAFHPTLPLLLSASRDGTRRIWDLTTTKLVTQQGDLVPLSRQSGFTGAYFPITLDAHGNRLLLGGAIRSFPELNEEQLLWPLQPPYVTAGAFSPDGSVVVTGHDDGRVRVVNMTSAKEINTIRAFRNHSAVYRIAFSPDGQLLVTCGRGQIGGFSAISRNEPPEDTTVRVWRVGDIAKME